MAGRNAIAREVQSMIGGGFQVAKSIVLHAENADGAVRQIGPSGRKRPMFSQEAKRIRAAAEERIRLIDEDEPAQGEDRVKPADKNSAKDSGR